MYPKRGLAYDEKGEYDLAIADFTQALWLNPNDAVVYTNPAFVYYEKGRYAHARTDWEQALQRNLNDPNARSKLEVLQSMRH